MATRRQLVLTLVATITTLNVQIKELERRIATQVREHPDGVIFTSLFKGPYSVITAAELLAEIGDCRGALPVPRRARWRRWPGRCRDRVRQAQSRVLSLGLQQAVALSVLHAGGQHPPLAPLGPRSVRRRPRPRSRPPSCATHPRTCLVPDRMALLAGSRALRPCPPPRATTTYHCHHPHAVGPGARPRCHSADGWRGCHPERRPAGPSAQRLTASQHPLFRPRG